MKFCTNVQNFGDELGRLSCEAMTIPSVELFECGSLSVWQ